jgi:hypothetical protein
MLLSLTCNNVMAENLNPGGVNPHQSVPRKRITQEQKKAAAAAQKLKKAEIDKRKRSKKPVTSSNGSIDTVSQPNAGETLNK